MRAVSPSWVWALNALAVLLVELRPTPVNANWLTKILSEAGEVGGKGAARGAHLVDRELGHAFSHVKNLPEAPGTIAVAAHAGPEGHWRFATRTGETYTAGTPDELARMRDVLLPGSTGKLSLYLTPDTVFAQRGLLKDLPADAELYIVSRRGSHRLLQDGEALVAEVRPGLRAKLDDSDLFMETLFQLGQPLKPSSLRILALETGAADALTSVPRFDTATRAALVDRIDPQRLAGALKSVKGQTVILTGRIEGPVLKFLDGGGGEGSLALDTLRQAARDADVNLVIVRAKTPRQPGGRNWLWQTASIPGLESALKQPTFGDFLSSIGPKDSVLTVSAKTDSFGRVLIEALPPASSAAPLTDTLTGWVDALAGDMMGRIAVEGIDGDMRDEERQAELDRRIIPGLNSWIQIGYLVSLGMALFGIRTAWRWWERVWPAEERGEYGGSLGYAAARVMRGLVFALLFLPFVGLPLFLRTTGLQIWGVVTAPFRVLRWLKDRLMPRTS